MLLLSVLGPESEEIKRPKEGFVGSWWRIFQVVSVDDIDML